MKGVMRGARRYLLRAENGAGLLFVALAFAVLAHWARHLAAGAALAEPSGRLFHAWTLVSFAVATWLAFLLLRRQLSQKSLRRVLFVAAVHAVGAFRFYDFGLVLLSVLPLFALLAATLLPANERDR